MTDAKMELVEIEVDADLLEQLKAVITPMGITPEMLIVRFFEWCVAPETRDDAMAWLLKHKEDVY